MATRPELVQMCKELNIKYEGLSIKEMSDAVKKEFDRKYRGRRKISISMLSQTLFKFITKEYNYVLRDKDKKIH